VVLACGSVNRIDSTGLTMLLRVSRTLADADIGFHLSEIKGPLMQALGPANLAENISGEIFFSNDAAMRALTQDSTASETGS
jgi:SulP family sulfate permease